MDETLPATKSPNDSVSAKKTKIIDSKSVLKGKRQTQTEKQLTQSKETI